MMSSASTLSKVTSLVIDSEEACNMRAFREAFAFNWDYFKLDMEFYYVPIHWGVQEKVLRLYREIGQLGHDAVAVYRHVEPKIMNHSGFMPLDDARIKQWGYELVKPVEHIEKCLTVLVDNEFFDLRLFQQGFLTSVSLQKAVLRLGHKTTKIQVRIPIEIMLVKYLDRMKYCTTFDDRDNRLIRAYSKCRYNKILETFQDEETMHKLIDKKGEKTQNAQLTSRFL